MSSSFRRVLTNKTYKDFADVSDHALHVKVVSGGGGGGGGDVNIAEVGGVAVPGSTVPVDDNGGSLTVDGSVDVDNFPASQTIDDGGGSITVDGTVSIQEPLSVDDNGGSLTVDGTVAVSSVSGTVDVDIVSPDPLPVRQFRCEQTQDGELYRYDVRNTINSGGSQNLLIETGDTCVHARFVGHSHRLCSWTLFEGPTHNGTINLQAKNKNLCSVNTADTVFHGELVVSDNGTQLFVDFTTQSAGGQFFCFGEGEIVLEANTKYLFKGFNASTSSGTISQAVEFWEE